MRHILIGLLLARRAIVKSLPNSVGLNGRTAWRGVSVGPVWAGWSLVWSGLVYPGLPDTDSQARPGPALRPTSVRVGHLRASVPAAMARRLLFNSGNSGFLPPSPRSEK